MTANHFLKTLDDRGLDGALYPPLDDGVTVGVTDPVLATRRNLFTNPSAEGGTAGWTAYHYLGAYENLLTATGWPLADPGDAWPQAARTAAQNAYEGRVALNTFLARAALGESPQSNTNLGRAAAFAMMAFTALEAELVGATFDTDDYLAMVGPVRAALTLPLGYR